MATQIGKLAVQLSANSAPFLQGLKQTEKAAGDWSKSVEKKTSPESKGKGLLGGVASAGGSALKYGAGAIGIGGLLSLGGLKKGVDDLIKVDHQARMAGVSIGEFRGAMLAAGPAAGAMEQALTTLSQGLGRLETGVVDEATKGLQSLGLTSASNIEDVAKAISALDTPAQRAAKAYEVLGESAKEIMPLLTDNGAQLGAGKSLAEKFGLGADGQSVQALKDAKMHVEAFATSITNQLALGAAPIIEELGGKFDGLGGIVKSGAKVIAYGGAVIVEAWKGVTMIWDVLKIGFKTMTGYILKGVAWIAEKINWLLEKIDDMTGVDLGRFDTEALRETATSWLNDANKDAENFWEKMANDKSAIQKVTDFFDAVDKRANKTVQAAAKIPALDQVAKRFLELKKEVRSPLQDFETAMSELEAFKKQGLFAGNDLEALFGAKAFNALEAAVKLPDFKAPEASLAGTKEAYSAILRFERGPDQMTVQERIRALQEEAKRQRDEQLRVGKETLEELRKPKLVVKGGF